MGLLDTVKGWLNIGGVKVKLDCSEPTIYPGTHSISGKTTLTAKTDKQVLSLVCQVVNERTFKKDDEERTEMKTLGEWSLGEGFEIKAGETREIDFDVSYVLPEELQHKGGMLGAVGKFGAFAAGSKSEFKLITTCDVKGTVLDPSDSTTLKVAKVD